MSTANRFISRQLKQGSREVGSEPASQKPRLKQPSSSPIGIFVWGFPNGLKIKDLVESFAQYGDIVNGKLYINVSRHGREKRHSICLCGFR